MLGDSIAYGIGATFLTDTLAPRLAEHLADCGIAVETAVFAVPGARSDELPPQVSRALAWNPEIAVIVVGANDLTHLMPVESAAAALHRAVREFRAAGTEVVVAAAPDMSVVPHVPPAMRALVRAGSALLRDAQVRATLAAGGRVADVDGATSSAFAADPALFAADRFHPSSAGYEVIARALAPVVRAAAEAAAGDELAS
jgi:lysophospholipase L1-like esterase